MLANTIRAGVASCLLILAACAAQSTQTTQEEPDEALVVTGSTTTPDATATPPLAPPPPPAMAAEQRALGAMGRYYPQAAPQPMPGDVDRERYRDVEANPIHLVADDPVSTFSIDVD